MSYKRKRTNGNGQLTSIQYQRKLAAARRLRSTKTNIYPTSAIVGGITRQVGYYGRFSGLPTGELKFHDIDVDDTTVSATGEILNGGTVNIIPQGTTEVQRIGRKCTIKSINWRYDIVRNDTTAIWDVEVVRVILYLDKQANGATATVAGILESTDYQSFNNLANKGRFLTLMDRKHVLKPNAGFGDGTTNAFSDDLVYDEFFKKCNIVLEYDNSATTGVLTTIRSNNIGVLLISKLGTGTLFNSKMRLRFSDN